MLALVNYTLEQFIVFSAAQFCKQRQVWWNEMASMAASYECFQSLSVCGASEPPPGTGDVCQFGNNHWAVNISKNLADPPHGWCIQCDPWAGWSQCRCSGAKSHTHWEFKPLYRHSIGSSPTKETGGRRQASHLYDNHLSWHPIHKYGQAKDLCFCLRLWLPRSQTTDRQQWFIVHFITEQEIEIQMTPPKCW